MADAIPAANAELLAAQAKSGLDGVAAYKAAQDTLASQKTAAVQQAMQESAMRGSPAGAMDSQAGIIATPYDQRIASLRQGQGSFEADMAARDRRMADYGSATQQARTLIPGEVEKIVAPIRVAGEANVRNTEREGQMQVSAIDANTRLAMARMEAAMQAAQIAAAKKAASDKASAGKAKKLTGTDLTAMLSQGAAKIMGTSLEKVSAMIDENESKQKVATKEVRNAGTERMIADNPLVNGMDPVAPLGGLPSGSSATTKKPTPPPVMSGVPQQAQDEIWAKYHADLAAWQRSNSSGAAAFGVKPFAATLNAATAGPWHAPQVSGAQAAAQQAQRLAAGKAEQAANVAARQARLAPSLARETTAKTNANPALFGGQFGSITDEQIRAIAATDPYLAGLITNSPAPLTSKSVGPLLYGDPDQVGQPSAYSVDAASAARMLALKQLREAGYEVDDQDFMNSTTLDMKPGESFSQYQGRSYGQLDTAGMATAVGRIRSQQMEETRFQAWKEDRAHELANRDLTDAQLRTKFAREMATIDPDTGLPLEDQFGNPMSDSTADRTKAAQSANDVAAQQTLLTQYGLPGMPNSARFGNASNVLSIVLQPPENNKDDKGEAGYGVFYDALQTLLANHETDSMTNDDWKDAIGDEAFNPYYKKLGTTQKEMLKDIFYNPTAK